jgi:hypothetical protein
MVFDDEQEYVRFTDYVYERFGGQGLELSSVPGATVRLRPWLLEETKSLFAMRHVSADDLKNAREEADNTCPFDPENLASLRVPGVPQREKRR